MIEELALEVTPSLDPFILLSGIIVLSNNSIPAEGVVWSPQGLSDTVWKTLMEIASQDVKVFEKAQWGIGLNVVNLAFLKPSVKVEKRVFFFFFHVTPVTGIKTGAG